MWLPTSRGLLRTAFLRVLAAGAGSVALVAAVVLWSALAEGCARPPRRRVKSSSPGPSPVLSLRGRAEVRVLGAGAPAMKGPGAEGRAGDYLLENAFARFVVGAAERSDPSPLYAGGLIDAALQGGEDVLRVLAPHVGPGTTPSVVCEEVRASGPDRFGAVTVTATGHWRENPAVVLRTLYRLEPEQPSVGIVTSVQNLSPRTVESLAFGDLLYQGRAERFAEGVGLHPCGRAGQSDWLSFFEQTIPPGEVRTYRRRLLVAWGAPEAVAQAVMRMAAPPAGEVFVQVRERRSGAPVPGAALLFESPPGRPSTLAFAGDDGGVSVRLRAGDCRARCLVPGREPFECSFGVRAGCRHRFEVALCRPARLRVSVRERVGGGLRPTAARLTLQPVVPGVELPRCVPAFSRFAPGATVLVPPSGELEVPLSPVSARLAAQYLVIASKGPLYDVARRRVIVEAGRTLHVELVLRRVVDPGEYAAVDFGQRWEDSPESSLTASERALLNECEGLDGAVVLVHRREALRAPAAPGVPPLLAALEVFAPQTGRFSVVAAREDIELPGAMPPRVAWGGAPEALLRTMRQYFPRSLIQVEAPLDPQTGYFRLSGFRPGAVSGRPFSEHFDAIRMPGGSGGSSTRRAELLQCWYELLNRGRRVFVTGGSDSASVLGARAMAVRTYVRCPRAAGRPGAAELMAAVKALPERPDAFVSNGPFLRVSVDGEPPGSSVAARDGAVRMHVRVEAPDWISVDRVTLVRCGVPVRALKPGRREGSVLLDERVELAAQNDCWFVVLAEGEGSMAPLYCDERGIGSSPFAVTNPFWVDADGDGVVRLEGRQR